VEFLFLCEMCLFTVEVSGSVDGDAVRTLGRPFGLLEEFGEIKWLRLERNNHLVRGSNFE